AIGRGFGNMLRDIFMRIFQGKKLKDELSAGTGEKAKQEAVQFGAAEGGDDKFKIKDASSRVAEEQTEAVEVAVQGINEAVEDIFDLLRSWGTMIWEGFKAAVGAGWQWLKDMGAALWNGFTEAI